MNALYCVAFIALVVTQTLDIVSTMKALNNGAIEKNPLVRGLMEKVGRLRALIVLKSIIILLFFIALNLGNADVRIGVSIGALLVSLGYCFVIANNFKLGAR